MQGNSDHLRVVLDTNIYISALYTNGVCRRAFYLAIKNKVPLFLNTFILDEIQEVASRDYFKKKIQSDTLSTFVEKLNDKTQIIKRKRVVPLAYFPKDKDDVGIVSCIIDAKADILVTGNKKHFIHLEDKIRIMSASEFIDFIESM